jgi:antagonist of KipI
MSDLIVRLPGLLTTVQDAGRYGFQDRGVPPAGALDLDSLELANLLVGNPRGEAALECSLSGPELEFTGEQVFAITGAPMNPRLNGASVARYETLTARAGDVLSLGMAEEGVRAYVAIGGGFDLPLVMGSHSTYIRGGFGGFEGRALRAGDRLRLRTPPAPLRPERLVIPAAFRPGFPSAIDLRALPSHELDRFEEASLDLFFSSQWRVSSQSDRMGCRLEGQVLAHRRGADIISEGVQTGTVQVPGNGLPIVLLADRQTTGGYTRIAHVIKADLPLLGQVRHGDLVRFRKTTLEEARKLLLERDARWERITRECRPKGERRFRIVVNGTTYDVGVRELP